MERKGNTIPSQQIECRMYPDVPIVVPSVTQTEDAPINRLHDLMERLKIPNERNIRRSIKFNRRCTNTSQTSTHAHFSETVFEQTRRQT